MTRVGADVEADDGTGFSDVSFAERAVYLSDADALVVADLHAGRGEASAVSLPLGERADLVDRLGALLDRFDPGTVVVAGDAAHTFDRVTDRALGTLNALRDRCEASGAALELAAGNHDAALANAWDGPVREELVLNEGDGSDDDAAGRPRTVVCHGHEAPSTAADRYVIGHVHPTIEIEGDRRPCVLRGEGTYRGADLLVLPAFTRLAAGVPVNDAATAGLDTPLVTDAAALAPTVYDPDRGEPLRFPPLGAFDRLL
ncbi:metallophosphoesterase [Halorubrum sp. Atlit-26R]|uniref:metallophosphoesterase n=1 Tax=Halorubrum sp. Atlit-26R TaxID=2282128 RepID=UPI000EF18910|nr:metallophosphoesterase [Halorubrum sp. Atlit-26R]RLM72597.1 metallophosphoesterase [Halorubrum sp. Atlit-26R]